MSDNKMNVSTQLFKNEKRLEERCIAGNVDYVPPADNEDRNKRSIRRDKMLLLLEDPKAIERRNK